MGHHLLASKSSKSSDSEDSNTEPMSPSKLEYKRAMAETLNGCDITNAKIISYQHKAPAAPEGLLFVSANVLQHYNYLNKINLMCLVTGYQNNLKVLYSQHKTPGSCRKAARHIPSVPERILDAPELLDDYC